MSQADKVHASHAAYRTNPKGEPFIGTCRLCGKEGLTMAQTMEQCDNLLGVTQGEVLLGALSGELG